MIRLHLVRHGEAAAGWGADPDPGLSDTGRAQAVAVAERLAGLPPMPVHVSPLRRTVETAAPLLARWGTEAVLDPVVAEIPSPSPDLAEREAWLRTALAGRWSDLDARFTEWCDALLAHLAALPVDAVIVTHFVAINAVLGACRGDDRLVVVPVANTSVTVVDVDPAGGFHEVMAGDTDHLTRVL